MNPNIRLPLLPTKNQQPPTFTAKGKCWSFYKFCFWSSRHLSRMNLTNRKEIGNLEIKDQVKHRQKQGNYQHGNYAKSVKPKMKKK